MTQVCGVPNTQLAKVAGCFSDRSLQRLSKDIDDRQQLNEVLLLSHYLVQWFE
ncbi:hypothetical protein [Nostoc sp. ChiQUE01b]|uniref:hypothetical protein n=1 Tax=Nostoc sp. ChiQUE01b TaxID=3075376 RepID=UPI002AD3B763|nr:hypothetical protein [Nostoc sp. ChiQUE01b]MDZ8264372.1 hypothetical protein [Nostoc sp. ChiQUE01b]